MQKQIVKQLANLVSKEGGKTYYVGGYVRDCFLNVKTSDIDIEVYGLSPKKLISVLNKIEKPITIGKQFGIYSLPSYNIDIAMPRNEKNTGKGHKDFEIYVDPYIDLKQAARRRDFTINSIYMDVKTNEIIDYYNGINDIKRKTIRHIDKEKFIEDPLRVLRGCRYAATYNFKISKQTINLCKTIDLSTLPKQRVEEELLKTLNKSNKPSLFFKYLKQMNQLNYWFGGVNTKYIDKAKNIIKHINNKEEFLLTCISINDEFDISKITCKKNTSKYVNNMKIYIRLRPNNDIELYKIFDKVIDVNDYLYLMLLIDKRNNNLFDKYKIYKKLKAKPSITGNDLIKLGYKPNKHFNKALEYANELKLSGLTKKQILNKVSAYLNNINK